MPIHPHTLIRALACWLALLPGVSLAQSLTQTIRGTVVDADSKYPLAGVTVVLLSETNTPITGANTDDQGNYRLSSVPLGRQTLRFTYLGYQPVLLSNLIVTSAKELILPVEMMSSSVNLAEVEIVAQAEGEVSNEMAMVSARQFSIEETNRYAGSRSEPARMASNYAGVQGADDSRNDIVIRGNAPNGVLWRLEGLNVPNPNHFAIPGTGGGPVTILNNKFLANSDFFTGAFPASYGNANAGVFDLRMRNGNNERHEFSGQFGFLGTELAAEGPLSKASGASYLVMYRYSTLKLFESLNIRIGTSAVPAYQDGAFRLNFPLKDGASLSLWGMGGLSRIRIVFSDQCEIPEELYADDVNRDQDFRTGMGIIGATYRHPINTTTFIKASIGASRQWIFADHDYIYRNSADFCQVDSLPQILDYTFDESKIHSNVVLNKKIGVRQTLQAGINADWYFNMRYIDSARLIVPRTGAPGVDLLPWQVRWDTRTGAVLLQPFIQYKLRLQDKLDFTAGLTSLYFSINENSFSPVEPRLGLSYQASRKHKLSLGAGLHSQIQSPYVYFYGRRSEGRDPVEENLGMGLSKSLHTVLTHDFYPAQNLRMRTEVYYQHLYQIPVRVGNSSYSLVNAGSGFSRLFPDTLLVNEGTGRNYGIEFTFEKFFSRGYNFLFTGSLFDARYKGSDGVLRNSVYNGRYAVNALFSKEFKLKQGSSVSLGAKATSIGGRWYGEVDRAASDAALDIVFREETVNTLQFRPYFRGDLKVGFLLNSKRVSHEVAVDIVNVFNTRNILSLTYIPNDPDGNPIGEQYQLGFLPLFYYKIDF
ncbi:MAG: TonB-dependent receptor [Bacteroidia bacterium]|nr:TonB-dependent receptor [Bacteroidia bacterium]